MDRRELMRDRDKWYKKIDLNRMVATLALYMTEEELDKYAELEPKDKDFDHEEQYEAAHDAWENETILYELPVKMEVCGTCNGTGRHVNPSIDAGGLTRDDFDLDPDFAEGYFSGRYDVTCYECEGRNVVPEINMLAVQRNEEYKETYKRFKEAEDDRAMTDAIHEAERRMGA